MSDALQAGDLASKTKTELEAIYDEALGKLPSRAPIYLPTERVPMAERIIGVDHVRKIYQEDLDAVYRPKLRALRDKYKGHKRCFLIGNGPSLNRTDLNVLKDEVTFAVNGFFLKARDLDWQPTFYLVEDHLVAEDRSHWINKLDGPTKLFPAYLGYAFPPGEDTIFYNHRPRKSYPHGFDFSLEADKITYTGCTVTFSMMQIAAYLGFEEIYLIGVDASYDIPKDAQEGKDYAVGVLDMKSDDPNHFDPTYFGKGFRWHDPQVEKMVEAYGEARRVLEGTSQTIYNATVGGMLEVFERRDFGSLFPSARAPEKVEQDNDILRQRKYPKLLILDMTAMGNGTATGDVKASLFEGWPADRFLQIASHNGDRSLAKVTVDEQAGYITTPQSETACLEAVREFDPDIILYRPVPKTPKLHDFAMGVVEAFDKPIATWLMDDWPAELEETGSPEWNRLGPDLETLLSRAALNLSICDKMSEAFAERYGVPFKAFANGVNPVQCPPPKHHDQRTLRIRYSGGLAKNMTLDSVLRVAKVVEELGEAGHDVCLEINTQRWWMRDFGHHFSDFDHTSIDATNRDAESYRAWLSEADAVLIAYNFDEDTLRYVRYSMANKMPECLASGAVVLGHGPRDIATIAYLADTKAAIIVEEPSEQALNDAIKALLKNPARRNALSQKARAIAFDRHNLVDLREALRAEIASVSDPILEHSGLAGRDALLSLLAPSNDPRKSLIALSGQLLCEPSATLHTIHSSQYLRQNIDAALTRLTANDDLRTHFKKVMEHASRTSS